MKKLLVGTRILFPLIMLSFVTAAFVTADAGRGSQFQSQVSRSATFTCLDTDTPPFDLTGTWTAEEGGTYYVRQIGRVVWWAGLSDSDGSNYTNVFKGECVLDSTNRWLVVGEWTDLPRGNNMRNGTLELLVRPSGELRKTNETGGFGESFWTRNKK